MKTNEPNQVKGKVSTWAVCVVGIAISAFLFGPSLIATWRGTNDFMNFYSGGRLAFSDGMYDVESNLRVMRESAGWDNPNRLFNRPPFYALLLWPIGQLPFGVSALVWEVLILAAVVAFCLVWPGDRRAAAIACCWSFPLFYVFADGQDVAFLMVLVALAVGAAQRGNERVAGLLLALCSIKFHLFALLPLLILGQRRWEMLKGLAIGGAGLIALSFVPGGWNWPARYAALLANPIGFPNPEMMPSVPGMAHGMPHATVWMAAGCIVVLGLVWMAVRGGDFSFGLAAVLTGSILVAPHVYLSDCALLLPAMLLTMGPAPRFHFFLLSPLCSIWAMTKPTWITGAALAAYLGWMALRGVTVRVASREVAPV